MFVPLLITFTRTKSAGNHKSLFSHFVKNISVDRLKSLSLPTCRFWIAYTMYTMTSSWDEVKNIFLLSPSHCSVSKGNKPSNVAQTNGIRHDHRTWNSQIYKHKNNMTLIINKLFYQAVRLPDYQKRILVLLAVMREITMCYLYHGNETRVKPAVRIKWFTILWPEKVVLRTYTTHLVYFEPECFVIWRVILIHDRRINLKLSQF